MKKINEKSPPQVVAKATRTGFPVRQKMRPHDGFFMHLLTVDHAFKIYFKSLGLPIKL